MEFHLSSFRHCKVLEKPNLSLFPGWHFGGQAGSALPALLTGGRNVRFWQDLKCYPKWSKGQADLGWCGVYLKILFLYLYQVYISLFLDFRLVFSFFPPDITRTWINTKPFFPVLLYLQLLCMLHLQQDSFFPTSYSVLYYIYCLISWKGNPFAFIL